MFPRLLSSLLAVQLDDELLAHRDLNIVAERQAPGDAFLFVCVEAEPRRDPAPAAAPGVGPAPPPRTMYGGTETFRPFTGKGPCATICRPSRREPAKPSRCTTLSSRSS